MKRLLFSALLFSSVAFGQVGEHPHEHDPDAVKRAITKEVMPHCREGKATYMNERYMFTDLCINGLGAETPDQCSEMLQELQETGRFDSAMRSFFEMRQKQVCK